MGYPDLHQQAPDPDECVCFNPLDGAWAIRTARQLLQNRLARNVSIP